MPRRRQLPLDPEKSAAAAGLRYGGHECAGISRQKRGKGFAYFDGGKPVRDPETLARIRSLVLPPAWKDVWICRDPLGHLQAIGYDARGRRQYRYHPAYRQIRNLTKFERMPEVVAAIASARAKVHEHLALPDMPREKVLAALIRVLDVTGMRVGNEESAAENHTYGLTTLRNQHVDVQGATLRFHFTGKSGVRHEMKITDRRLARIVRQCHDLPGQQLFQYVDEDGNPRTVSSSDVNEYLRDATGEGLTARDFRTWAGTVECATALREIGESSSETEAKKNVVAAIKTAAARLGNRVATCRAYYVHPAVPDAYMEGTLLRTMAKAEDAAAEGLSADECAVLAVVRHYRPRPAEPAPARRSSREKTAPPGIRDAA
jgi:DNA topoisomerase-1